VGLCVSEPIRGSGGVEVSEDPRTSKEVRNLAFAHFTPDEFPTHRMLQELMMLDPMGGERDQIMEIATLILPWCRDGNYGCLFDGTSNLSLTGKLRTSSWVTSRSRRRN